MEPISLDIVTAFEQAEPIRSRQIDLSDLNLQDRLQVVDATNEVFQHSYVEIDGVFYKMPLTRVPKIGTEISKTQFQKSTEISEKAGEFQRIIRAVPYAHLYHDIEDFVAQQGYSLDDVVVVGIDRSGRIPSLLIKEILGKKQSYTIKVDQSVTGELDIDRLYEFIKNKTLKDKYVLFVDSTVDSGRQIDILKMYFDNAKWQKAIGHKSWGIIGSNEYGEDQYKHKDIEWGLNPDIHMNDDVRLTGVDYVPGDTTKVVECSSPTSRAIQKATLQVSKGNALDL